MEANKSNRSLLAMLASNQTEALRSAGYSASALRSAGYSASDLRSAGYSLSDLRSAGYSLSDLRSAGYSASALRSAGYSASALRSAGYSLSDLRSAGYSLSDLLSAGYSASALRSAGYSASDLLSAGYSLSDLQKLEAEIPALEKPYTALWNGIQTKARKFSQSTWGPDTPPAETHICDTAMCTAGSLVNMAGEAGYALKEKYGWKTAGALIHYKAHPEWPCQNFGAIPDAWALAYIEEMAERETAETA